jgi:N-methylhydantoinase B/oxoprolinase/acetone carboxylase alpha subunit
VIVTNDPHPSGVHLNDVSLISPVHWEGELLGYVANLAHHVDVGGGAPASIGAFREVLPGGRDRARRCAWSRAGGSSTTCSG